MPTRMRILTNQGVEWVDVKSKADASTIGSYWNAVRTYATTGDDSAIGAFGGVVVVERELETDLDAIDYWALRGALEFEDIYEGGN